MNKYILTIALVTGSINHSIQADTAVNTFTGDIAALLNTKVTVGSIAATVVGTTALVYCYCWISQQWNTPTQESIPCPNIINPEAISITLDDIAGHKSVITQLQPTLDYLKNPKALYSLPTSIPTNLILHGPSGNGKTMIVKALAKQANCPLFILNDSEIPNPYFTNSTNEIVHIFEVARSLNKPCIIAINQFDCLGTFGNMITQALLHEMKKCSELNLPIVIIGLTSNICKIDKELLQPHRFDRIIAVEKPFFNDRIDFLKKCLKTKLVDSDIQLEKFALATEDASYVELESIINQAVMIATQQEAKSISIKHLYQALDNALMGHVSDGMDISQKEAFKTAVHESGHAILIACQKDAGILYKVTIQPRDYALGLTWFTNDKEKYKATMQELKAMIITLFGGSIAEELIFGQAATGISNDIARARKIAMEMVMVFGMAPEFKNISLAHFMLDPSSMPSTIAEKVEQSINAILQECLQQARAILTANKNNIITLSNMLMEQKIVDGSEVYKLCGQQEPELKCARA